MSATNMAGPKPDSFKRALKNFKHSLPPDLAKEFEKIGTLRDVQAICMKIQDEQGQDGCLRRLRRIEGFIEAMDQLGKSIDVFLNASEFICFVWGPVKFLLGVAKNHLDSFDKLLDAYAQVGAAIPGLMVYRSTFEKHPPLANILEDYYSDILRFHEAALKVFTRPRWKTVFQSAWKTFDTQFQPILRSLSRRSELLESEKVSASLYEISRVREQISDLQEESRQQNSRERLEKHKWRLSYIKERLQAPDYCLDHEMATEDRNGSSSGGWVLQHPHFRQWICKATSEHGVLYINGIPGAGKTTLISAIIEKLLDENCGRDGHSDNLVVYYYFKHKQPGKNTHNSLLRAVMEQIVTRDPVTCDFLFEKLGSMDGVNLRSTKTLESLITTSLGDYRACFIVLDGLDEAASGEATKSINWLLSLLNGSLTDNDSSIRVLFCGQRDGILDTLLSNQPSISLEVFPEHSADIRLYCAQICAGIRQKFCISPETEEDIISRVTDNAKGMFLYARVVLNNLLSQTKRSRLMQEIEPSIFPSGMDRAYERVAIRIFEESPAAEREDATKILGWLTCAQRFLRWREIQSLFCIDPEAGTVDYEDNRLRVSCKQLCGSLVDVHRGQTSSEDIIKIVHGTARDYLVRRQWLNLTLEHAKTASFCFRYLTSEPFLCVDDSSAILLHARKGYYALQDYAVQHCWDHFEKSRGMNATKEASVFQGTMELAGAFLSSYSLSTRFQKSDAVFQHDEILRFANELPKEKRDRADQFSLGYRTISVRKQIEAMRCEDLAPDDLDIVNNLYGPHIIYKCHKPWCDFFLTGFETEKDRTQHTDRHDRPFRCAEKDCFGLKIGFETKSQLDHHQKDHHTGDTIRFPQPRPKKQEDNIWNAAEKGELSKVAAFLDKGVAANHSKSKATAYKTPLYFATLNGHLDVCNLLLERGRVFPMPSDDYMRLVDIAMSKGRRDIWTRDAEIYSACNNNQMERLRLLLDFYRDDQRLIIADGAMEDAIGIACKKGFHGIIHCLLEQGYSEAIRPDHFRDAESGGHRAVAGLLRPILAHRQQLEERYRLERGSRGMDLRGILNGRRPPTPTKETNDI